MKPTNTRTMRIRLNYNEQVLLDDAIESYLRRLDYDRLRTATLLLNRIRSMKSTKMY